MHIWSGMFLGLIQGITEFLPISSSGHLVLFQRLMGLHQETLAFDVLVHFGTLIAVCAAFFPDVVNLCRHPFSKQSQLIWVATIPTATIGLLFKDTFEKIFDSGATLGIEFILSGTVLALAARLQPGTKGLRETTWLDASLIGVLQGAAIMPALSRSGLTITGALARGLDRAFAAKLSFLVSIPAIFGATLLETTRDVSLSGMLNTGAIAGCLTAAVSGYICVRSMVRLITNGKIRGFIWYLWIVGMLVLCDQLFFHRFFSLG